MGGNFESGHCVKTMWLFFATLDLYLINFWTGPNMPLKGLGQAFGAARGPEAKCNNTIKLMTCMSQYIILGPQLPVGRWTLTEAFQRHIGNLLAISELSQLELQSCRKSDSILKQYPDTTIPTIWSRHGLNLVFFLFKFNLVFIFLT